MDERSPLIDLETLSPEQALAREWLCTNGLGSYAMGSLAGANTRRYHGLLVAALAPPVGRTVLCAKVDEIFDDGDGPVELGANEFHDGTRAPWGVVRLTDFRLDGARPTWHYAVPGGVLRKSVWMEYGRNTTYLRYTTINTGGRLRLNVFATYRDYHHETHGSPDWHFDVAPIPAGAEVHAFPGAVPWRIRGPRGSTFRPASQWWWRFHHAREAERGLDCEEDLLLVGALELVLAPGRPATVVITTEPDDREQDAGPYGDPDRAWERQQARERHLVRLAGAEEDPVRAQLALAADQFLVRRGESPAGQAGTIIAGYPWFSDWGRDTMIALPGLTLATGRHTEARAILATFARYLDQGMLPNRFPDHGEHPDYNTADATLWFFQAIAAYETTTGDTSLADELLPALDEVVSWHLSGTRYGIGVDPADGLLRAGSEGCQLTWMDAKVGDWVVTPRHGKPVEINALWYNALRHMENWAGRAAARGRAPRSARRTAAAYADLAQQVAASFNARFPRPDAGTLFDVVDTPAGGDDPAVRPNQILALSLPHAVLEKRRARGVLEAVGACLLTPVGLRTLAPGSPGYQGTYAGDQWHRDGAYHQGTIWPWLLGPYVDARRKAGATEAVVRKLCQPLVRHLWEAGVGSISEVFGGDAPYPPGGCPAQAWSVSELLRVLTSR